MRPPETFFLRYPHELSAGQRQRVVIAGGPPDASRVPEGCRFRPRCPFYSGSEDAALRARCETQSPAVLQGTGPHAAACHATP
jgi:peptide/nickel transport system ATP-binding protein